ncbi:MAG: DUF3459 domain-containing protein, partial [Actinomycetota bacterium]|nr:DUF3459 domain-containing protein [Actinomycetota bacterium]
WSDDLHHCLHVALTGEQRGYYEDVGTGDLERALSSAQTYQGRYSPHRRRTVGRSVDGTPSDRFVVSLQNHDQVGNRAAGERLHHLVGVDRTAAAAALVLLSPFAVLVFQGEEWATDRPFPYFSDHAGELGEAVRQGRIGEFAAFGWPPERIADPQSRSTFESAILDWDAVSAEPHADVLEWYRSLIALRRTHPSLDARVLPGDDRIERVESLVAVRRGSLQVVVNLGGTDARWDGRVDGEVLLERGEVRRSAEGIDLSPGAVVILDVGRTGV